jgi:hypothetical protein
MEHVFHGATSAQKMRMKSCAESGRRNKEVKEWINRVEVNVGQPSRE